MARVCGKTRSLPGLCWCTKHGAEDPAENARRRLVGEAAWEWKGGEALHVFTFSKMVDGLVSLCNLRHAQQDPQGRVPTKRCEQCLRTLLSQTPNIRMTRYLQERSSKR